MEFLHSDFWIGSDDVVIVTLDHQANAMLLDESNFSAYRQGRSFNYYGGWATHSPVRIKPPHAGHWHVVIDLGGRGGTIRAEIRVLSLQP
jgi:hypothetical protein